MNTRSRGLWASLHNRKLLAALLPVTAGLVCVRAGHIALPWPVGLVRVLNTGYASSRIDFVVYGLTLGSLLAAVLAFRYQTRATLIAEALVLAVLLVFVIGAWSLEPDPITLVTAVPFGLVTMLCWRAAATTRTESRVS